MATLAQNLSRGASYEIRLYAEMKKAQSWISKRGQEEVQSQAGEQGSREGPEWELGLQWCCSFTSLDRRCRTLPRFRCCLGMLFAP